MQGGPLPAVNLWVLQGYLGKRLKGERKGESGNILFGAEVKEKRRRINTEGKGKERSFQERSAKSF